MMQGRLTPEQLQAYQSSGGSTCPWCGAHDITGDNVTIEGNEALQEVSCSSCGVVWTDVYTLAAVTFTDEKEEYHDQSMPVPVVLVTIEGGCFQGASATHRVTVTVRDIDHIQSGDDDPCGGGSGLDFDRELSDANMARDYPVVVE